MANYEDLVDIIRESYIYGDIDENETDYLMEAVGNVFGFDCNNEDSFTEAVNDIMGYLTEAKDNANEQMRRAVKTDYKLNDLKDDKKRTEALANARATRFDDRYNNSKNPHDRRHFDIMNVAYNNKEEREKKKASDKIIRDGLDNMLKNTSKNWKYAKAFKKGIESGKAGLDKDAAIDDRYIDTMNDVIAAHRRPINKKLNMLIARDYNDLEYRDGRKKPNLYGYQVGKEINRGAPDPNNGKTEYDKLIEKNGKRLNKTDSSYKKEAAMELLDQIDMGYHYGQITEAEHDLLIERLNNAL